MLAPDGASMMVVALTPSDRRALTNMRALAKKISKR
jgi:transcriptional/translational regulatory protein YebC/TACO1